jgi:hypothetical protein
MSDKDRIDPDTRITDHQGHDWAWAFVVFAPIPWAPQYQLGTNATVWSNQEWTRSLDTTWHRLKCSPTERGYPRVGLTIDGKLKFFLVHRLFLEVFIGPCPPGMECLHRDGDSSNCSLSNLRWGTPKENVADSIRHGTFKGVRHTKRMIKMKNQIIHLWKRGANIKQIMRDIGVSRWLVRKIVRSN